MSGDTAFIIFFGGYVGGCVIAGLVAAYRMGRSGSTDETDIVPVVFCVFMWPAFVLGGVILFGTSPIWFPAIYVLRRAYEAGRRRSIANAREAQEP